MNAGLKKYSKYIPNGSIFASLASAHPLNKHSANNENVIASSSTASFVSVSTGTSMGQTLAYKQIVYECVYMYKTILERLNQLLESNGNCDITGVNYKLFELVCHFLNELFLLSNNTASSADSGVLTNDHVDIDDLEPVSSIPANVSRSASVVLALSKLGDANSSSRRASVNVFRQQSAPSQLTDEVHSDSSSQLEAKLDRKFFEFMNTNLRSIYKDISEISQKLDLNQYISILISSQLILFKYQQSQKFATIDDGSSLAQSAEHDLSKTLINTVNENINLLDNELIIGIMLELYMKCVTFRHLLNECADFHLNLTNLLNKVFDELHTNTEASIRQMKLNYLEILLDLIFVFFYFNRRVTELFVFIISSFFFLKTKFFFSK